ncbi:retrovirus-related pol polyprotein from transposon TNT 1-94 [Tanacetum coccineum]
MIRHRYGKTPYELLYDKPPDLSYLHVFGALCYPTNDCKNLGKLHPKADIGIFIGYAPTKKSFRIYNRRTRRIIETIHVNFDELTAMASEHSSSGPALHEMTPVTISLSCTQRAHLVPQLRQFDHNSLLIGKELKSERSEVSSDHALMQFGCYSYRLCLADDPESSADMSLIWTKECTHLRYRESVISADQFAHD